MHEEVSEKISRLIDNDLDLNESYDLLKKIQVDEQLKLKMMRYQALSQVLKTDQYIKVPTSFSKKVFQEIQNEPTHLLPKQQVVSKEINKGNKVKLYALAASTIIAVVLVGQFFRSTSTVNTYLIATNSSQAPQQMLLQTHTEKSPEATSKRQMLNAQFNEYLQAHNSSVYTNGEADFRPFATVTSYGQD